jgi:uncharacterized protein (DUF1330 family)
MKTLFSILLCFISFFSFSQTNPGTLEVIVSDTMLLVPDNITYEISVTAGKTDSLYNVQSGYDENTGEYKEIDINKLSMVQLQANTNKIEQLLKTQKVKYRAGGGRAYTIEASLFDMAKNTFTVEFTSMDQVKKLYDQLLGKDYVTTAITNVSSSKSEIEEKKLYENVIKKAKEKATFVAGLAGKKAGAIISISEVTAPGNVGDMGMGGLFGMLGALFQESNKPEPSVVLQKTLTVKFEML